jgi:hypothetical protein
MAAGGEKTRVTMRTLVATVLAAAALAAPASAQAAMPIPQDPSDEPPAVPAFMGSPANPHPVRAPDPPRHPHMAPNGRSNLHDDAYQTDTYRWAGPLGHAPGTNSNFFSSECGSVTFDRKGRIVTVCVGLTQPTLRILDPDTLDSLASMSLPPRQPGGGNPFTDFSGGGYFYLDDHDRAVLSTNTRHLFVIAETPGPGLKLVRDYDLTGAVPLGDKIISALPDWRGRIWFASVGGIVGTVNPRTGSIHHRDLKEGIGNSFAVDETGGVYIVSNRAIYRFDARPNGKPKRTWRRVYHNTGTQKPGQSQPGSGTTPTLMGKRFVAITDNADPMDVVIYRRRKGIRHRLFCKHRVLAKGAGSTDQSLIGTARSVVVENNFGYTGPAATENGGITSRGLERIQMHHGRCRVIWTNGQRAPSVVPKLSLANGLVYTYTKPPSDHDPWYLTAISFRTGKTIFRVLGGTGLGYNNNYAPVTIARDGDAYVGVLGGIVRFADGEASTG